MSDQIPPCPECASEFTYESGDFVACPMCGHEWVPDGEADVSAPEPVVRDAVGNVLRGGDDVSVVKTLKVKGSGGGVVKIGTKVRGIQLIVDSGDGHDIDAKVPGMGQMKLKSSVVKKLA